MPKELTEEATTDHQDEAFKKLAHFKTFYFFIFYDKQLADHLELQVHPFSLETMLQYKGRETTSQRQGQ